MTDDDRTGEDHPGLPAIGGAIESVVDAIDDAVPAVDSPANTVVQDRARAMPWLGVLFGVGAAVMIPWLIYLGASLPERQSSAHYNIAWAGFDVFLFLALAATSYAVLRRAPWVGISAGGAAALLITDAWFDVVTAQPGSALLQAVLMAVLVELPMAAVCLWLCRHADRLADRRLRLALDRVPDATARRG